MVPQLGVIFKASRAKSAETIRELRPRKPQSEPTFSTRKAKMTLPTRDIAIITVLCAVAFLACLTYITYRFNPSLFKRQHRARPGPRRPKNPEDSERINPVKLSRFISNTTMGSHATNTTQHSTKSANSTTAEVPAHIV